jgi:hypothetical protein
VKGINVTHSLPVIEKDAETAYRVVGKYARMIVLWRAGGVAGLGFVLSSLVTAHVIPLGLSATITKDVGLASGLLSLLVGVLWAQSGTTPADMALHPTALDGTPLIKSVVDLKAAGEAVLALLKAGGTISATAGATQLASIIPTLSTAITGDVVDYKAINAEIVAAIRSAVAPAAIASVAAPAPLATGGIVPPLANPPTTPADFVVPLPQQTGGIASATKLVVIGDKGTEAIVPLTPPAAVPAVVPPAPVVLPAGVVNEPMQSEQAAAGMVLTP